MPRLYKQSEATAARRRFPLFLVGTDGLTPATAEAAGQPQLSKSGAAFVNTTATLVAIANGQYYVELTAAELDTLGLIQVRYKSAATAEFAMDGQVAAFDPYDAAGLGLSRVDAAITTRSSHTAADVWTSATRTLTSFGTLAADVWTSATRALTDKTGFALSAAGVQAIWDVLTSALVTVGSVGKRIADNLDAAITGRASAADYTAARAAKLDNLDVVLSTRATSAALATVQADTDDLQARLPAALVAGRIDASIGALAGDATAAANLARSALGIIRGAAIAGTLSTTQTTTDLASTVTNFYVGRILIFTTGARAGEASDITAYNGTSKMLTYTAMTGAAAATDQFVIV